MKGACFQAGDVLDTFLLLGRYGDIINILPILKYQSDLIGHPVSLIVCERFANVLDAVSYAKAIPVPFDPWHGLPEAIEWADKNHPGAMCLQPNCAKFTIKKATRHFDLEPYALMGLLKEANELPVVFDERNTGREAELIDLVRLGNDKPILLVNLDGISNSFSDGAFLMETLKKEWGSKLNIVNTSDHLDYPIFFLIALMEIAIGMVTIDTATAHLSRATDVKFIFLYKDSLPEWATSSTKKGCVLSVPYSQVRSMMPQINATIGRMLNPPLPAIGRQLSLASVTLVAIDTFNPQRTASAMKKMAQSVEFKESVLVTCPEKAFDDRSVKVLPVIPTDARIERERFLITRITEAFSTSHCLHVEWDSGIRNVAAWDNAWLQYDFIGAPWPSGMTVKGFPRITENTCVGNTGFCLISKRFADALAKISNPSEYQVNKACDIYIAVVLRPALERLGLKFAPRSVAEKFSCEGRRYSAQFGWHGKGTASLNNFPLEK